jgi:Ser/Thr protein kinase RdoA (MazF antagonist)
LPGLACGAWLAKHDDIQSLSQKGRLFSFLGLTYFHSMNPSFPHGANPFFPAAYSTLETTALAGLVSEKYGLFLVRCQFLLRGVGDTYLIESAAGPTAGRYILRAYRASHRNEVQIRAEVELLLALKRAGVSVSYPVSDLNGEPVQVVEAAEGQRHLVLFSYASGHPVAVLSPRQLQSLGREMARFHDVSARFGAGVAHGPGGAGSTSDPGGERWRFDPETTLFGPLVQLDPYFSEDRAGYAWLVEAAKVAEKKLSGLDRSGFSSGYCQFDFLPKNFHFDGDSVTFFDFDFMGFGWLVNDIMSFWQHLTVEATLGRMAREVADEAFALFLDAYQSCRPVSKEELEAIPYLSLGFWLFYMGFHTTHDQFYPFIQPAQLKLRLGLIQQLMTKTWASPYPAPRV